MKDQLQVFNEFANKVARALNDANVRPDTVGNYTQAILIMVAPANGDEPYGGSLNYNDSKDTWEVDTQLGEVTRLPEEGNG